MARCCGGAGVRLQVHFEGRAATKDKALKVGCERVLTETESSGGWVWERGNPRAWAGLHVFPLETVSKWLDLSLTFRRKVRREVTCGIINVCSDAT